MKSDAPMVMMMSVTTSALRAGSIANFSTSRPARPAMPTASRMANGSGMPAVTSTAADIPPNMMNSPCAKLITPLAL